MSSRLPNERLDREQYMVVFLSVDDTWKKSQIFFNIVAVGCELSIGVKTPIESSHPTATRKIPVTLMSMKKIFYVVSVAYKC